MKTFQISVRPKKGSAITKMIMQASCSGTVWQNARVAYPDFVILQVKEIK